MTAANKVLVVEDEQHLADGLKFNLEAEGHEAVVAGSGEAALDLVLRKREPFDIVILDVMLPGKDGFEVASELRAAGQFVPILMLTARGRPEDVLSGFEAGADDYLPKPFELSILLARVNGLLRRRRWNEREERRQDVPGDREERRPGVPGAPPPTEHPNDTYTFAGRILDFDAMEIHAGGTAYRLTQMECDLLRYLVKNAGRAVSRGTILEEVWGLHEETDTRAIDNFIVRLRRYLEDRPSSPRFLLTVRGVGYKFVPGGEPA